MKKLSLKLKRVMFAAVVAIVAVGASAFTIEANKLAPGDYRFYNISGVSNSNPNNYRYHTSTTLCSTSDLVCSEVWNIDEEIPADGDLASDFTSPVKVGLPVQGDYTGN